MIRLPEIKPKTYEVKEEKLYNANEYYEFHRQPWHGTNRCRSLKHIIKYFIDKFTLDIDNPLAISN